MMWQKRERRGGVVSPTGVLWVAVLRRRAGGAYGSGPGCPRCCQRLRQAGREGHPGFRQVLGIVGNYGWEKPLQGGWPGGAFLNPD